MLDLEDIFGRDGPLARALPDFKVRREQLRMAEGVSAALAARESLVVEAGTGTGKTFAYLVPALLSGKRVLISTGTRTLQDQLFARDLPVVSAALGRPARVALLKGRSNYLCRHRLTLAGEQLALAGARVQDRTLARISRWSYTTRSGDLAEVPGLSDAHPIWQQVTSTRDNCLGAKCGEFSRCHVALARRSAQESDVVVVNHHLLLADLALKEDGFGDILGSADALILDEAHQIPDLATQFFGANVSSRQIETLLKDLRLELAALASGVPRESTRSREVLLAGVEDALRGLRAALPAALGRVAFTVGSLCCADPIERLIATLEALAAQLTPCEHRPALSQLAERSAELAASLARIAAVDELEGARTLEVTARGVTLSLMPFDI